MRIQIRYKDETLSDVVLNQLMDELMLLKDGTYTVEEFAKLLNRKFPMVGYTIDTDDDLKYLEETFYQKN